MTSNYFGPRDPFAHKPHKGNSMDRIQTTHPAIGEAFGGGYFAGLIRIGSNTYGLIVAPKADGEISTEWGTRKHIKGADSFFDGHANTKAMADADNELGAWAKGLTIGGDTRLLDVTDQSFALCCGHSIAGCRLDRGKVGGVHHPERPAHGHVFDQIPVPVQRAIEIGDGETGQAGPERQVRGGWIGAMQAHERPRHLVLT